MLSKSHSIILFIDRFGFNLYQDTLADIAKFNFTPDLVSNLDIVSKEQFVNLLATFIQINKIVPSGLAVILSDNVIYIKDLDVNGESVDNKEHQDEIQNFLENVPFEEVLAKVIKSENVNRIVAVNKDLVMTIINTFVDKGATLEAITPGFMYGQSVNFTAGLTLDNIRVILSNAEILRLGNLLTDQERIIASQNLRNTLTSESSDAKINLPNSAKNPKNLRQYLLISVFVVLLIILAVVYLNMGAPQTPPKSPKVKNISENTTSAPTVIPILTQVSIATAPADLKSIKIKIVQNSQVDDKVANLKNELLKIGFQNIANEVSESLIAEKSSVIFSQNIPMDLRNNIIVQVKKILPDISILEDSSSDSTINILMGKS